MVNSNIYYNDFYWNDLEQVNKHLNKLISGKSDIDYIENFRLKSSKKFSKALVLNCGNGHVEREFIRRNIIDSAIGIDISKDLINQAKEKRGDMKIDYILSDINSFNFESINFDLLIVFAAGHHIKCLHKVFSSTRKKLIENNGMIVGFDYIGAHRNQYDYEVWEKINYYNKKLPEDIQNELTYPHLPTMLKTDPSEAIHSELLEEILKEYYDLNFTKLGGGIAYEILSHNNKIRDMINKKVNIELINSQVKSILDWDIKESRNNNKFNFFASFYGYPNIDLDENRIYKKVKDENLYEKKFPLGATYYKKTFLQNLTEELSDKSISIIHKQSYINECHKKIDELTKLEKISRANYKIILKRFIKEKLYLQLKKLFFFK